MQFIKVLMLVKSDKETDYERSEAERRLEAQADLENDSFLHLKQQDRDRKNLKKEVSSARLSDSAIISEED